MSVRRSPVRSVKTPKRNPMQARDVQSKAGAVPTVQAERKFATLRPPPRLVRRTLQDNVYDYLREALMTGEYAPGDRLTVRGVATAIGTSIMPVREAFRRLSSEGGLEPLSTGAIRVPVFDQAKLQDLTEIRVSVESLAARRAAHRITALELEQLEQCNIDLQRCVEKGNVAEEVKANEQFHFTIYRAAHSSELLRIIEHLWLQMGPYLSWLIKERQLPTRGRGLYAFRHHKDIILALRRRDAARAEAAVRSDLQSAGEILLEQARKLLPD